HPRWSEEGHGNGESEHREPAGNRPDPNRAHRFSFSWPRDLVISSSCSAIGATHPSSFWEQTTRDLQSSEVSPSVASHRVSRPVTPAGQSSGGSRLGAGQGSPTSPSTPASPRRRLG